ncbi:MAG: hypothetical protein GY778_20820, partial [bacterium]|nr:hypothetical protein [bacterium]
YVTAIEHPAGTVDPTKTGIPAVWALQRSEMIAGGEASWQRCAAPRHPDPKWGADNKGLTPADCDGPEPPPAGAPALFARHRDDEMYTPGSADPNHDFIELWELSVDWISPDKSTFKGPTNVAVDDFRGDLCGGRHYDCIPQPPAGFYYKLNSQRSAIMWRLQYRVWRGGGRLNQGLLGNFVTSAGDRNRAAIRWFILWDGDGQWGKWAEGTIGPQTDTDYRWMGSAATDKVGNLAIIYNRVGLGGPGTADDRYPSSWGAWRTPLPGSAAYELVKGTKSSSASYWGDYSSLNLSPDGCTFWGTAAYVKTQALELHWATEIIRFKLDSCP